MQRASIVTYSPADLAINGVDLKAANGMKYTSPLISLLDFSAFFLSLIVDNAGGGAAGVAKITAESYDGGTLLFSHDILTAIPTNTTGITRNGVIFGLDFAGKKVGGGTLGADIDAFKLIKQAKFIVEVVTANNGTTSAGYLRLLGKQ